jgi:plasmid stability protein
VKQLLLRVPDHLHQRLAARAGREGRSVNALATEILDAAADADQGDRRSRLRAKAVATGMLRATSSGRVDPSRRRRILASAAGAGRQLDRILAEGRGRR